MTTPKPTPPEKLEPFSGRTCEACGKFFDSRKIHPCFLSGSKPTPAEEWKEKMRQLLRPYAEKLKFSQADWKTFMRKIEAIVEKPTLPSEEWEQEFLTYFDQPGMGLPTSALIDFIRTHKAQWEQAAYERGKKEIESNVGTTLIEINAYKKGRRDGEQAAAEKARKDCFQNINSKEKQEQILGTLLVKLIGGEGEYEIFDKEIIVNDWVVFETRNPEKLLTIYRVLKNKHLT